ncbi:MAG: aromatic ring-hydroxylating dioxygenase subunit alpha [Pseudomonadota bacterium]
MPTLKSFPLQKNAWYAAALCDEISDRPLAREILGRALVFYRLPDGRAVAMEDRCPHRLAPLSPGKLIGDAIECPYHGLRFGPDGMCTFVPGQARIPARARVATFPVVERYGLLWVWPGEGAADPSKLPDWRWAEDPEWTSLRGHFPIACHYMLSVDNLMDLSHIGYVHASTIGSAADAENAVVDTLTEGTTVTVRRWVENVAPSPTFAKALGSDAPIDRWQIIEFQPPAYIRTFKGLGRGIFGAPGFDFRSAEADAPAAALSVSRGNTCITPATETSCHYFTVHCHFRQTDEDKLAHLWQQTVETLEQDVEILEQTQKNVSRDPDASLVTIHVDEGVEKARQAARMAARAAVTEPALQD